MLQVGNLGIGYCHQQTDSLLLPSCQWRWWGHVQCDIHANMLTTNKHWYRYSCDALLLSACNMFLLQFLVCNCMMKCNEVNYQVKTCHLCLFRYYSKFHFVNVITNNYNKNRFVAYLNKHEQKRKSWIYTFTVIATFTFRFSWCSGYLVVRWKVHDWNQILDSWPFRFFSCTWDCKFIIFQTLHWNFVILFFNLVNSIVSFPSMLTYFLQILSHKFP